MAQAPARGAHLHTLGGVFTTIPIVRNCTIEVVFDGEPLPEAIFADGFEEVAPEPGAMDLAAKKNAPA